MLDLLVECLGVLDRAAIGEHGIRMFARKPDAGIGGACLKHHRLSLPGALDVERPLDPEEPSLVVEPMQLRLVRVNAGCPVTHEGVVVPTVPEPLDRIEILVCDLVTQLMFRMFSSVVAAGPFERRCHRIPTGAAAADEVERGKLAGDRERVAVGGRNRADETDLRSRSGERRQDG